MKAVDPKAYITSKDGKTTTIDHSHQSGVFEPANSHHRWNKDNTHLREMYKSIFVDRHALKMNNFPEYGLENDKQPMAIQVGAERISSDGYEPKYNLVRNAPLNVQAQRV